MISFIIPTVGRRTLQRTVDSIDARPGDEIIIVGQPRFLDVREKPVQIISCAPGGDWGNTERNVGLTVATCPYLAFIDDDDWYAPDARALQQDAIDHTPGRLVIFRMQFPTGLVLWETPELRVSNVGTPMFLMPNDPTRLGRWPLGRYEGDWGFLQQCRYLQQDVVWRSEVIALIGRDIGQEKG
jgi:hypothetical protein